MSEKMNPESVPGIAPDFTRLVKQYQAAVLRVCYLYLCDRSQAEDAVQDRRLKAEWPEAVPSRAWTSGRTNRMRMRRSIVSRQSWVRATGRRTRWA